MPKLNAANFITKQQCETGQECRVNTYTYEAQKNPAITSLSDGGYIIVWESFGQDGSVEGIYGQLFDQNGVKTGQEFRVNTNIARAQITPSVSKNYEGTDNRYVIVWSSDEGKPNYYDIFAKYENGVPFKVNSYLQGDQKKPQVTCHNLNNPNPSCIVTWQSNGQDGNIEGVYARRISTTGPIGEEVLVNTQTIGSQKNPVLTLTDNNNSLAIAWETYNQPKGSLDDAGIFGQLFDLNLDKIGDEFLINQDTNNTQKNPAITSTNDGGFVVIWEGRYIDNGIYGQKFYGNGTRDDVEFQVHTTTYHNQAKPSIISTAEGFVAAWTDYDQDNSANGVYYQSFYTNTSRLGYEYRVNQYLCHNQQNIALATSTSLANTHKFIAAWESFGQDGSAEGIYSSQEYIDFEKENYFKNRTISIENLGATYGAKINPRLNNIFPEFNNENTNSYTTRYLIDTTQNGITDFIILSNNYSMYSWVSINQTCPHYQINMRFFDRLHNKVGEDVTFGRFNTIKHIETEALNDNGFVKAWSVQGKTTDDYHILISYMSPNSNITRALDISPSYDGLFTLSPLAIANAFMIAFMTNRYTMLIQSYSVEGEAFNMRYNLTKTFNASDTVVDSKSVADGSFVLVTSQQNSNGISAQRFDINGNSIGNEARINSPYPGKFLINALQNTGDYIVAWQADVNIISAQIFDNHNNNVTDVSSINGPSITLTEIKFYSRLSVYISYYYDKAIYVKHLQFNTIAENSARNFVAQNTQQSHTRLQHCMEHEHCEDTLTLCQEQGINNCYNSPQNNYCGTLHKSKASCVEEATQGCFTRIKVLKYGAQHYRVHVGVRPPNSQHKFSLLELDAIKKNCDTQDSSDEAVNLKFCISHSSDPRVCLKRQTNSPTTASSKPSQKEIHGIPWQEFPRTNYPQDGKEAYKEMTPYRSFRRDDWKYQKAILNDKFPNLNLNSIKIVEPMLYPDSYDERREYCHNFNDNENCVFTKDGKYKDYVPVRFRAIPYNCIAWSINVVDDQVWPVKFEEVATYNNFVTLYRKNKYEPCKSMHSVIDLYKHNDQFTHAAIKIKNTHFPNGQWSSKLSYDDLALHARNEIETPTGYVPSTQWEIYGKATYSFCLSEKVQHKERYFIAQEVTSSIPFKYDSQCIYNHINQTLHDNFNTAFTQWVNICIKLSSVSVNQCLTYDIESYATLMNFSTQVTAEYVLKMSLKNIFAMALYTQIATYTITPEIQASNKLGDVAVLLAEQWYENECM